MGEASCAWDGMTKKMFDFLDDRHGEGTPQNMSLLRDEKDPLKI